MNLCVLNCLHLLSFHRKMELRRHLNMVSSLLKLNVIVNIEFCLLHCGTMMHYDFLV